MHIMQIIAEFEHNLGTIEQFGGIQPKRFSLDICFVEEILETILQ